MNVRVDISTRIFRKLESVRLGEVNTVEEVLARRWIFDDMKKHGMRCDLRDGFDKFGFDSLCEDGFGVVEAVVEIVGSEFNDKRLERKYRVGHCALDAEVVLFEVSGNIFNGRMWCICVDRFINLCSRCGGVDVDAFTEHGFCEVFCVLREFLNGKF